MPYARVSSTLATLPVVAEQAWSAQNANLQPLDFPVPTAFQGKTIEQIPLPSNKKVIALTFDDGPSVEFSNKVLYILDKYNIKATFFLLGRHVQQHPERVLQMHNKGHALANHSWSHPYRQLSPDRAAAEIEHTSTWIEKAAGVKSKFFRPPGGFLENGMANYAMQQGQTVVMWSADSKDFNAPAATIVRNVLQQAGPGGIILLHDGGGDRTATVIALPQIIDVLLEQGYTFVTVPELMELYEAETQGAQAR
ncbi:MAG: polysaccharide deacetylase family protein [Spirulina sp. SIO3F2]|nr:polysaccharide deacetylase family protein [Spirulina sp. SIO3F2]